MINKEEYSGLILQTPSARVKEIHRLNHGGPSQRQHQATTNLWKLYEKAVISRRRAIKEDVIDVSHDWINS